MLQSHRRRLLGKYGGFLAFVLPAMIIYTIFVTYPLFGGTFVMSLKKYNVIKGQSSLSVCRTLSLFSTVLISGLHLLSPSNM